METIFFQKWKSPIGDLFIYADQESLIAVTFKQNNLRVLKQLKITAPQLKSNAIIRTSISQFEKYFKRKLKTFQIPIRLSGTEFQVSAWNALRKIPHGEISSYQKQAKILHNAKAIRAVGAANARNPISIIVPCHRIVGSNGNLTGYAGGISVKAKLLEIEGFKA